MAKKIIRTGTTADPTGDSLKNAFVKVNDNFTELYNALGLDADLLNLGAFEFTGSVMTTTDSSAIVIDQAVTVSSNLSVGGDIVPQTANGGDLGSLAKPFRSLYVSNNTVFLGGVPLSLDASNNLTVNGSRVGTTSYNDLTNKPTSFSSLVNGANTVSLGSDGALTLPSTSGFIDRLYSDNGGSRTKLEKKIESSPTAGTIAKLELDLDNGHIRLAIGNYTGGGDQWIDTSTWAFRGDTGSLTLPANGSISAASGYNITLGDGLRINQGGSLGNANEASWGLYGQNSDAGTYITIPGRTASENGDPLIISHNWDAAINIQGGGGTWSFGFDGNLTIPGDIRSEGNINIEINLSDSTKRIWQFGEDGLLTFPDGTSQSTAVEAFSFSVAADDSTQRAISNNELIKFIGAGGITTSSDAEGYITITGSSTYTLPTATTSVLGGVKVDGSTVTINGSGVISINAGLAGTVTFKGGWNASTNTPEIGSLNGTTGWMYIVTVGGTRDLTLGAGPTTYAVNDLVIYDGTNWILVTGNNGVLSFNTRTGAVTLTSTDVTTALGFTPYNATNPDAYLTSITSGNVTSALGYTPIQASSLSVSTAGAAGAGSLSYSNGVFTFTPAAAYTLPTATTSVLGGVKVDNSTITITAGVISVSSALTNAVQFKGGWNASTNTPALSASLPAGVAAGWEYIVSDAGTRDIGSGSISYEVNDLVIYNGTAWIRIPGSSSVVSFNTRQGAITLNSTDVTTALGSTTANYILAAPNGTSGTASFRAAVLADISNLAAGVATFLATPTSSNLLSAITDETGTGKLVFSTSPTVTTSMITDSASFDLLNTTATTVNFAGAATTLSLGAATGTASVNNATVTLTNAATVNVNGANPTVASISTGTLTLFNTNLLTVNFANAATTVTEYGAATSLAIGNVATAAQTVNMFTASTGASTYNIATGATANATTKSINIGTAGVSGSTTNIAIGSAVSGAAGTTTISTSLTVTPATTGTVIIGATTGTGALTFGQSTASQTVNIATGVTASGNTKTIAIGTTGASGSTTAISIGSTISGATSTLTFGGTVADATATSTAKSVGYLGLPQSGTATTATLTIGDASKHIYITTTGQTITIPAASSVAYPIGTTLTFIAGSSATTTTIAIATDTLRLAGGTSTGSRTLAANGMATAVKVSGASSSGVWYINGTGLT